MFDLSVEKRSLMWSRLFLSSALWFARLCASRRALLPGSLESLSSTSSMSSSSPISTAVESAEGAVDGGISTAGTPIDAVVGCAAGGSAPRPRPAGCPLPTPPPGAWLCIVRAPQSRALQLGRQNPNDFVQTTRKFQERRKKEKEARGGKRRSPNNLSACHQLSETAGQFDGKDVRDKRARKKEKGRRKWRDHTRANAQRKKVRSERKVKARHSASPCTLR
eukprot:Opistho-1_new@22150